MCRLRVQLANAINEIHCCACIFVDMDYRTSESPDSVTLAKVVCDQAGRVSMFTTVALK